ncbi:MAG: ComEA family DNA-binding protein [Anaerolineae bacterium]
MRNDSFCSRRVAIPLCTTFCVLTLGLVAARVSARAAAAPISAPGVPQRPLYALLEASQTPSPDGIYPVFRPADPASQPARDAVRLLEHQGVTVEPRALWMAQERAAGEHEAYLQDLRQRLLAGQVRVDSALPPQIWLRNPDTEVGAGVFDVYRSLPRPYHFNLNAATIVDLRTVPGVDAELARQIVQVRDKRGGFDRLEGLAGVPGMTPETMDRFRNMQSAMYVWINEGASNPEDVALSLSPVIWLLVWRLLAQLALAWVVAGLVFGVGRTLQTITATRLGLEVSSTDDDHAGGRARSMVKRGGRVFIMVFLPVTLFFLVQLLLIAFNSSRQVSPLIFALAVWLILVLLPAGQRAIRRRQSSGVALHHAGWALITYVAMFAALGWLAGV